MKTKILRWLLSLLLLAGVYTETGIYTTSSLFLIFIALEIFSHLIGKKGG